MRTGRHDVPRAAARGVARPRSRREPAPVRAAAGAWLLVVVLFAGAALMAFEIVGSRLLAPYFGSSTYVWGSLIGVFLGALACGYAMGGRLADRRPTSGALAVVLALAAVLVATCVLVADPLQRAIVGWNLGIRRNPLVASVVLFGPASVLMGMVSPYAVRLRAGDLSRVGATAGALYGLSTAGSIAGTFAASFWLVQRFGSESTVLAVSATLAACAIVTAWAGRAGRGALAATAVAACIPLLLAATGAVGTSTGERFRGVGAEYSPVFHAGGYRPEYTPSGDGTVRARADSSYHRIRVVDYPAGYLADEPTRVLHFDNSLQAAARLDASGDPVTKGPPTFGYLRVFDLVPAIRADADRVLLIGLGSGAAAMRLHELRPRLDIDVVEIDPKVVEYARAWFGYRDSENGNPHIRTHVGDGRTWLAAQRDARFDAVILDTYFSDSIPFHLTTLEFLELVRGRLAPDGIVAANLIGAVEGPRSDLLRAMHATWAKAFGDVVLYPVRRGDGTLDLRSFGNVEFVASAERGVLPPRGGDADLVRGADLAAPALDAALRRLLADRYPRELDHAGVQPLTDDLAPVDSLLAVDGI